MFDFFKKKDNQNKETQQNEEKPKSFWHFSFDGLKKTISNTTQNLVENVVSSVEEEEEFDDFILDDMEDLLIKADLGVNLASSITDKLRKQTKVKPSQIKMFLKDEFSEILKSAGSSALNINENGLSIFFITGVNGAGKTTLIAKLANNFRLSGKKVLLAAGDTFRAAAEEQLDIWAQRAQVDIYRKDGIDSAAVVFDAIKKAQNENYDILLIDTAGRLHNKKNLMEELNKVKSVIDKLAPGCLTESMLVLDANTGQNGLSQAKLFSECVNLTSVALTKLDGSAKGGIIIAIAKEFNLPVKLIGVGEKIDDLKLFNPDDFINALFEKK
ncbi:signal recognition particle-docking protein FtsY [bacterium]|nr:signal recognition particle-docking protein FtsY [bacterium]